MYTALHAHFFSAQRAMCHAPQWLKDGAKAQHILRASKTLFIIASHGVLRQKVFSKVEELEEERNRGRETRQEMNLRGELNGGGSSDESSRRRSALSRGIFGLVRSAPRRARKG